MKEWQLQNGASYRVTGAPGWWRTSRRARGLAAAAALVALW